MTGPTACRRSAPGRGGARRAGWRLVTLLAVSAVAVGGIGVAIGVHGEPARGAAYTVLGWIAAIAVAVLRRRAPGPGVVVAGVLSVAALALQPVPPFALLPFAVGVVVAVADGAWIWAAVTVGAAYAAALVTLFTSDSPVLAARGVGTMTILLVALGAGTAVRARRARAEEEERRRAARQQAAVEQERLRIARELHDVLAHSLSSISVQAGVGLHLAADRPEAATEALTTIRTASREALDEVRGVLGILRGAEAAPRMPGPDLDAVQRLVAETRLTGARIELLDDLAPRPALPVQLALYRIVQEALTNARRHAPGAGVEILLSRRGGAAIASIRDRLAGSRPADPAAGNGITGMHERAAALGGTLELTVHDDGIEVAASIPLPASEGPA